LQLLVHGNIYCGCHQVKIAPYHTLVPESKVSSFSRKSYIDDDFSDYIISKETVTELVP